jgi:hypothetical protein
LDKTPDRPHFVHHVIFSSFKAVNLMFYEQIVLAKKGPLGVVWMAAHAMTKKLAKQQIVNANLPTVVEHIMSPRVWPHARTD